jgi:hypothetical protein
MARLFEMLAGAKDSAARIMAVQNFLLRRLGDDEPNPVMRQAMHALRRNPTLPVRQLATQLDMSERRLSRQFRTATGATRKQFARIVRIGVVRTGEAFQVPPHAVHRIKIGDRNAKACSTLVVEKGKPLVIPA